MATINNTEMKRPRGRPRLTRTSSNITPATRVKQSKTASSKTPELYIIMTEMEPSEWNQSLSNDLGNLEQNPQHKHQRKDFERSTEYKIRGDSKQYQTAMQTFIEDSISNGKTKMKFEFVIK